MANSTNSSLQAKQFIESCNLFAEETDIVLGLPSEFYRTNYVIVLILNIVLTMFTISLNAVTIVTYTKSAQLKRKTPYFLIMLLSVNDLLVGLLGNTSFILVLIAIITGRTTCRVFVVFELAGFCVSSMSFCTLFQLNIERYLSIVHPLFHLTKVTKSKLLNMYITVWVFIIAFRLSFLAFGNVMNYVTSVSIAFTAGSTLYFYTVMLLKVRRRQRVAETRDAGKRNTAARVIQVRRTSQMNVSQNTKMAKSCGIVVATTYICFIPYAITCSVPKNNVVALLSIWSITLSFSSSSLNSLIFFWNNPILRKEAKQLLQNLYRNLTQVQEILQCAS